MSNNDTATITERSLTQEDLPALSASLARDEFNKGTPAEFFTEFGTVANVYEDEAGPVCVVRGNKVLRVAIHFTENANTERNQNALRNGVATLAQRARANGFLEVIFTTNNPALATFAVSEFGFTEAAGEYRRVL